MTAKKAIALDCETTGLYPEQGDRIIEIGAVVIEPNHTLGATFHTLLNPEMSIPDKARSVHGITNKDVENAPRFKDIMHDLMNFIRGSKVFMHNAPFDHKFLFTEFNIHAFSEKKLVEDFAKKVEISDTLATAQKLFPTSCNTLTALAKRFDIKDNRELHGALEDACLLAHVCFSMKEYINMVRSYSYFKRRILKSDLKKETK